MPLVQPYPFWAEYLGYTIGAIKMERHSSSPWNGTWIAWFTYKSDEDDDDDDDGIRRLAIAQYQMVFSELCTRFRKYVSQNVNKHTSHRHAVDSCFWSNVYGNRYDAKDIKLFGMWKWVEYATCLLSFCDVLRCNGDEHDTHNSIR